MDFGVFDHLDSSGAPLHDYYEARLRIIEIYDRAGFYGYHVAEHHATPLGMAPSPSVFLSAVAQRTKRLRFGPMIYALPLYHPLRMIEEICMLDQMSGGRLDMGFGRGASPIELGIFGQDPEESERVYTEALDIVLAGLTGKTVTYHGKNFTFDDVPMELGPFQKPYPPLWYGVHSTASAARAARNGSNVVTLDKLDESRAFFDAYRAAWKETRGPDVPLPKIGLSRFVVVAETDREALALARRAYRVWHKSFNYLFTVRGSVPWLPRPPEFDALCAEGKGVAGSPETVTEFLRAHMTETGANYFVGQHVFGDMTPQEAEGSLGLFIDKVMPALRGV